MTSWTNVPSCVRTSIERLESDLRGLKEENLQLKQRLEETNRTNQALKTSLEEVKSSGKVLEMKSKELEDKVSQVSNTRQRHGEDVRELIRAIEKLALVMEQGRNGGEEVNGFARRIEALEKAKGAILDRLGALERSRKARDVRMTQVIGELNRLATSSSGTLW